MIPTRALALFSALAYAATCTADVLCTNPVADTQWQIGGPAVIHWRLNAPTAKTDIATIYLVGGNSSAYQRIETLGKNVVLGEHKWTIPKVSATTCGSTCAIEFVIESGPGKGDHYSHPFTIAPPGAASAGASSITDKSTSASGAPDQNAAAPNGPITLVQDTVKGAQPHAASGAAGNAAIYQSTLAIAVTAAMATASYFL
ncbi:hypothetical protein EDD11_000037 [Mortierella claussenii]|nr:hypothetical protein EDD11_000037 [Mortierella claussenii]